MKKTILCLTLLFAVVCTVSAQKTCYLTEKSVAIEDRVDVTAYTFDKKTNLLTDLNRPSGDGSHYLETYNYGNGVLNSMQSGNFSFLYFHDDQDRIIGFIDYDDLGVSNSYHTMDYDAEGRLVKLTSFETPFLQDTVVAEFNKYYYEGDKMVKMETYTNYPDSASSPSSTTTYEYNDKKNPEYNPICFPQIPKHVITKEVYTDSDGIYEDFSHTRECTYNEQGYPVKCTLRYMDGSEKAVETYTYKCK